MKRALDLDGDSLLPAQPAPGPAPKHPSGAPHGAIVSSFPEMSGPGPMHAASSFPVHVGDGALAVRHVQRLDGTTVLEVRNSDGTTTTFRQAANGSWVKL